MTIAYATGTLNSTNLRVIPKLKLWKFTEGILGAFWFLQPYLLAPKISVADMFLLIVVAQLFTSIIIDHFGFFELYIKSIQTHKFIGLEIVFVGIIIFSYKDFQILA